MRTLRIKGSFIIVLEVSSRRKGLLYVQQGQDRAWILETKRKDAHCALLDRNTDPSI